MRQVLASELSLYDALDKIVTGLKLLGDGITIVIQILLNTVGFDVPNWIIRLIVLGFLVATIWKFGRLIPKIALVALAFIFFSTLAGLLIPSLALLTPSI